MNKKAFLTFLEERIRRSGISARDVAKRAGLSHGLLSMLLSGKTEPSLKVGVLLAWALNSNPANLYRDMLEFLTATGHVQDLAAVRPLDELLKNVAENDPIWIYAPDDFELLQKSRQLLTEDRPFRRVLAFTRIEHARVLWDAEPDSQEIDPAPSFTIKTPPENLLTRSGPLIVLHPHNESRVKLYRWLPDLGGQTVELPMSPNNARFVKSLEAESKRRNVYELAAFEKGEALTLKQATKGAEVIVITYTQTFPELEDQFVEHRRLQRAVSENLASGVRYLYLSTEREKISEIQFNKLQFALRKRDGNINKRNFHMLPVVKDFPDLLREETLVVYAVRQPSHAPVLLTFISQEGGNPVRFNDTDTPPSIQVEFIDKILETSQVQEWLKQSEESPA